ncbi:MAG: cytochrome c biogenesis protein CcsA [Acidimicrobiales bacterium]
MTVTPASDHPDVTPPPSTSSRLTRTLGSLSIVGVVVLAILGLVVSPADVLQRDSVRLMYVHVPVSTWMYVGVFLCALGSFMWLRKRTDGWDALAASAAEVATVLVGLSLVTGMVWGRPTWGVYWVWDARLTSTAILFVLLLGYQALRRYPTDATSRSRMSAVLGLLLIPNAAVIHYSVDWWRSLHQGPTIKRLDATIEGSMLFTLFTGFVVIGLVAAWLLVHRFRLAWLERRAEQHQLDAALAERRADTDPSAGVALEGTR